MRRIRLPLAFAFALLVPVSAATAAEKIARGVHLIPGHFVPNEQPDGNTVVLQGKAGLIVVDSGRHAEHTQAIIDFARAAKQPIAAIVNTHWHLDHIAGNPMLRDAYPNARVFASGALADAQKGFLANYRAQLEEMISKSSDAAEQKSWRAEVARIDAGARLAPDEVISASGRRTLAGRTLDLHLETHAVTAGDVWLFDPATRVLVSGDLVTVPVPFLDTACPARWRAALDGLGRADFAVLIPGHGRPMQRADFEIYRKAYGNLVDCAASKRDKSECISGYMIDAASLIADQDPRFVKSLLDYYVDVSLRGDPKKTAALCGE